MHIILFETFEESWCYVKYVATPDILWFLLTLPPVGNKNDDPSKKQVETADALRFGESVGVRVFETSAKENINVEEVSVKGWCAVVWHFKQMHSVSQCWSILSMW